MDGGEKPKYIRNASYLGAVDELADHGQVNQADVRAGMQKILQVFITNAGNIFLLEVDTEDNLTEQVGSFQCCERYYVFLNVYLYSNSKTTGNITYAHVYV